MFDNMASIKNMLVCGATALAFSFGGSSVHAASQLTYDSAGHVIGFSLEGVKPAGNPNFENYSTYILKQQGPEGFVGDVLNARLMQDTTMYLNIGEDSFEVMDATFRLHGNFDSDGNPRGPRNFVRITGTIDDPVFGTYSGLLVFANLTNLVIGDDLIGMNTSNIICPQFDFCTDSESVYIDLDTGLTVTTVPVPGAVWLFGSGLLGLFGMMRKRSS